MYCTVEDLKRQVPAEKLYDLAAAEDGLDTDVVNTAITDAAAEINGYAGKQYPVPFTAVPDIIRKIAVDIALYNLFSRRGFDPEGTPQDGVILLRYKAAVQFLQNLAKNIVVLDVTDGSANDTADMSHYAKMKIKNEPRIFTRRKMRGY